MVRDALDPKSPLRRDIEAISKLPIERRR